MVVWRTFTDGRIDVYKPARAKWFTVDIVQHGEIVESFFVETVVVEANVVGKTLYDVAFLRTNPVVITTVNHQFSTGLLGPGESYGNVVGAPGKRILIIRQ